MKPLFPIVVAILVVAATAHPENIEDVKELPQSKEPIVEAEASAPQARKERCTTCSHSLKSQNELFQALKSLPNAEVHTQETFEGCSSEKGCAGIKKVDGAVIEKFGNLQALNGAASAGVPNTPFWWMNQQNSPFKAGAAAAGGAGGGSFEKFSKSSSSFTSSSTGGAGGVDLGANPFLNGEFAKLGAGFNGASNFGSSQSEIDITKNQFLNGQAGFNGQSAGAFGGASQSGANSAFGSQSGGAFGSGSQSAFGSKAQGFGSSSQTGFGASGQGVALSQGAQGAQGFGASQNGFNSFNAAGKFGSGYSGSSPAPFTPTGSNVNLIQNSQKNEFDYTQQQQTQQNIDEVFQSTGNVQAHESSGGDLQQTCAGQGYVCVLKSQCNNGVVNTNGGGLLQANTQKQYCNTRTEICCRIETASLAGAGNLQGSLGVGSATYSGNQGLFGQSASASNQNSFGATGFGSNQASNSAFGSNQASNTAFGSANRGSSAFGSNQFGASGSFGTNKFASTTGTGFGSTIAPNRNVNNEVFKSTSQTNFVETDSFSSGSDNSGIYRPGAIGTVLKPGIPYLPPVDTSSSGSNVVSTAYTPAFVTTPRPFTTPRPITTQRVYSTPKPTYLPPISTKAPEYLPPVDGYTASDSFPHPSYIDGQLILDENLPGTVRPPPPAVFNDVPSGCAAALKCTPIEFCTADGVVSNTTVILSRDQEAYRVPLTDCKDLESGRIGKCCRDPYYTDPWPVNQLGKWVPGVFGGNDGTYTPDNRGSPNNPPRVTVRPPTTGTIIKDFFPEPTPTPTYYAGGRKKIVEEGGFGERRTGGFKVEKGQRGELEEGGFGVKRTGGFNVERGQRTEIEEGGLGVKRTGGFKVEKGQRGEIEEGAFGVKRTGGFNVEKGQRTEIEEGGFGIKRTGGFGLERGELTEIERRKLFKIQQEQSQENGLSYGNEASESIQRVFLKRYQSNGECGLQNPQRPYGNHKDLELDFAEIPWQAMILLQTNKSLLCGGVITRPDVVITSASCVEGLDARNVLIKGGEWKLGIDDEPLPFQIVQVKHILRHPGFVAGSLKNDAAILVLTENLRLAKNIWPICLPSSTDAFDAFYNGAGKCIVTGWGKSVLQAHLEGSIIHGLNVSLLNPGQCENKISQDYPHLRDLYDQESCACGQPTNPTNNICKVDIGSAIACTTDDSHYVLRGIYSWDSGCQVGNQLAGFYKFDLEWYEWAIGLIESVRFSQYTVTTTITKKQFGVASTPGVKGTTTVRKTVTTGFQPGSTITGISGIAGATKTSGIQGSYNSGFNAGITGATKTSGLQGSVTTVTNQKVITTGASGINSGLNGGFGVTGISGASKTSGIQGAFNSGFNSGITGATKTSGVQGSVTTVTNKKIITTGVSGGGAFGGNAGISGNSGFQQTVTGFGTGGQSKSGGFSQFGAAKYDSELTKLINSGEYQEIKSPVEKTFSTYSRQFVQTQPEVTYVTLKPVVKTFEYTKVIPIETKTEYFKLPTKRTEFTYTKPEIRYDYQTSGSQTNQQIVAPSVSFTPSFSEVTGTKHIHDAKCKCLENGKK
ncbi:uncharacterized protein LOC113498549 isoform X3 [Trichoplusia ni]|uniref:Uncharacterized protein LOC113498549 isoform X3 n=1 Tax=Trichoplusia ni TaxID=7111 RepID=A0A7E5W1A4_TRINI|nr:uncharacterized protein LOC113498549 isoform X3 [Trichoplusia ni]